MPRGLRRTRQAPSDHSFFSCSIVPRFFQVIIALWMAVRFPTTANQSIMISSQFRVNAQDPISMSNQPSSNADITTWIMGKSVESTTLSARPRNPA